MNKLILLHIQIDLLIYKKTFSKSIEKHFFQLSENFCLCLEDSTVKHVPKSFKNLIHSFSDNELHTNEVFAMVLYILAVECGFTWNTQDKPWHQRNYFFNIRNVNSIPKECITLGRIGNGEYRFILYLGAADNFRCTLSISPCSEKFVVNIFSIRPLICYSQAFIPSEYLENTSINFSSFRMLCVNCKNNLFYPMKSYILKEAGIKNATIQDMPFEIFTYIIKFITFKDFQHLCSTNHYLYNKYGSNTLIWKYFCKRKKYP